MDCDNISCKRFNRAQDNNCDEFLDMLPKVCRFFLTTESEPVAELQCSEGLSSLMDNVLASTLGDIAREAGSNRTDVGDSIDRGLILRRLLEEKGFSLIYRGR